MVHSNLEDTVVWPPMCNVYAATARDCYYEENEGEGEGAAQYCTLHDRRIVLLEEFVQVFGDEGTQPRIG